MPKKLLKLPKMKSFIPKKMQIASTRSSKNTVDTMINYILVISLVLLLAYAFIYIVKITQASKEAFDNNGSIPSFKVLYVYSNACGYCRAFHPTYEKFSSMIAEEYPNIELTKKEISEIDPVEATKLDISAFPTIVVFDSANKEIARIVGKRDLLPLLREVKGSFMLGKATVTGH
jgi:thiol-disulfide isomerase/thioredoxin